MNQREVIISKDAFSDLESGKLFYDSREAGVGQYFIDSIIADLESLQFYSGIHIKCFDCHRMLSKRFPFAIYYTIDRDRVIVMAILDMRRNPTWIWKQIRKRAS
jgi:hypothetical protein